MATLVGEAAIRIIPTTKGFKELADGELQKIKLEPVAVRLNPDFKEADAKIEAWRKAQEAKGLNIRVNGTNGTSGTSDRDAQRAEADARKLADRLIADRERANNRMAVLDKQFENQRQVDRERAVDRLIETTARGNARREALGQQFDQRRALAGEQAALRAERDAERAAQREAEFQSRRADRMVDWAAKQEQRATLRPKVDESDFNKGLRGLERNFAASPLHKLTTFNIKILGLDALPVLAYAAASAASGLNALAAATLALPGLFAGAMAGAGALSLGLMGVSQAFQGLITDQRNSAQRAKEIDQDNRALQRSYRDYATAVREATREIQDLNDENRASSLDVGDALLAVQEATDRLNNGDFSTVTEYTRAQLDRSRAVERLNEARKKANRTQEDANRLNAQGVSGNEKVLNALDQINQNVERLNFDKLGQFGLAMQHLSPNVQAAMVAVRGLYPEFLKLQHSVADNLFQGINKDITTLATALLPTLGSGLSRVASGINTDFHQLFGSVGKQQQQTFLQRIFGNTDIALRNLAPGIQPLIDGFTRLMAVSSNFLPRLGTAAAQVFDRFDQWTAKIDQDGSLKRWIDQGLHAMDDLGRIGSGVISIFHSVGQAFDAVSGHNDGFLGTFANEMTKIKNELNSSEGMAKLEGYLRGAKNEWNSIRKAWDDAKPTIRELVGIAREFSTETFGLVGNVLKAVSAFDRLTGALGPLMEYLLILKTFKMSADLARGVANAANAPIRGYQKATTWWDNLGTPKPEQTTETQRLTTATNGLTTALTGEAVAAEAASGAMATLGQETETANTRMDVASRSALAMERDVTNFVSPARTAADGTRELGSNADRAATQMTTLTTNTGAATSKLEEHKQKLNETGEAAGGAGASSMKSKIGALAGSLGGGLAGLGLQAVIVGAIAALDNLGQAHHRAATAADEQRQSLHELASAVDSVTGAAGKAAQQQTIDQAKHFTFGQWNGQPGGQPQRNVFDDNAKAFGLTPGQVQDALQPQNQQQRDDWIAKGDAINEQKIGQSEEWKRNHALWEKHNVDLHTLALAAGGDPAALKTVSDAYQKMQGELPPQIAWLPETQRQAVARSQGVLPADLGKLTTDLGVESFSGVAGIRSLSQSLIQGGVDARQSNQLKNGTGRWVNPGIGAFWNQFGAGNDDKSIAIGDDGLAVITTTTQPTLADGKPLTPDIGDSRQQAPGVWQTTLTADATKSYIQVIPKAATGGLVGGVGGPTDDANLYAVSRGEHISRAAAVDYYGTKLFDDLNNMRIPRGSIGHFSVGGTPFPLDGPDAPATPLPPPPPGQLLPPPPIQSSTPAPGSGLTPPDVPGGTPHLASQANSPFANGAAPGTTAANPNNLPGPDTGSTSTGDPADPTNPDYYDPSDPNSPPPPTDAWGLLKWKWDRFTNPDRIKKNVDAHYADALSPKNVFNFAGQQAKLAGTALLGMGTEFLSGITGLNFSEVLGPADELGNWMLKLMSPTGTGTPGSTSYTNKAQANVSQFNSGQPYNPSLSTPNSGPTSQALQAFASSVAGKVPYAWGGFSMSGMDCSGLALAMANIATGHGPFDGGRNMATGNEGQVLASKGFVQGPGGTGDLTIGWSDTHTGVTLPDGSHIDAEGTDTGIVMGKGSQGATGFPNVMHLPVSGSGSGGALSDSYLKSPENTNPALNNPGKYASGGYPSGGLAWLSKGEFRTGSAATKYYGPGLFNALNAMAIPRHAGGGWALDTQQELLDIQEHGEHVASAMPSQVDPHTGALNAPAMAGPDIRRYEPGMRVPGSRHLPDPDEFNYVAHHPDTGQPMGSLSISPGQSDPQSLYINMVKTLPQYRGQGVAKSLLERLISDNPGQKIDPGVMTGLGHGMADHLLEQNPLYAGIVLPASPNSDPAIAPLDLPGKSVGGLLSGPGTGTSDSIVMRGSNGEYMIRAASVGKYGLGFMDSVNAGTFADGGWPDQQPWTPQTRPAPGPTAPGSGAGLSADIKSGLGGVGSTLGGAIPGLGAAIGGGAQLVGGLASGGLNIVSGLLSGSLSNGASPSAYGVPALPQRQPVNAGPPVVQRVHNGDVHVTNLDEYKRTQETMDAQLAMPFIGKYW